MLKPRQFGRYILIDRLSTGGMAEVYLAKSSGVQGFEKVVAIKRILPTVSEDPDFETMFIDEAKISARLAHSNIGQVFEFGQVEEQYYIAMEYIPGKDLRAIQTHLEETDRVMDVPMALHIASRVCQALDYAHRQKDADGDSLEIIHRDISPPNVIVSFDGAIKLIDFGIAKATSRTTRTRAGKLKGKFAYMSPEQVQGKPIDHRSDVFSLGVLLHELLNNRRLFHGESQLAVMQAVRRAEVDPPSTINPDVPLDVDNIVLKALARSRDDRYAWASEVRADIERYFARTGMIYDASDLSSWMQAEFAGDVEAERRLLERLHELTGEPEVAAGVKGPADGLPDTTPVRRVSTDAETMLSDVSAEIAVSERASGEVEVAPVPGGPPALPGRPTTDLRSGARQRAFEEDPTVGVDDYDEYQASLATRRRTVSGSQEVVPTADDASLKDTDRRDLTPPEGEPTVASLKDTDRRTVTPPEGEPTVASLRDTDRRTVDPADGEPTPTGDPVLADTERRMAGSGPHLHTSTLDPADLEEDPEEDEDFPEIESSGPKVLGPSQAKVRQELVNWPTAFSALDGEGVGGVDGATPLSGELAPDAGGLDPSLDPGPTRIEPAPALMSSSSISPGEDRDSASVGGALEVDSNPDKDLLQEESAVDVADIDRVVNTSEMAMPPTGVVSGTQELSDVQSAQRFTSMQVIIIAAGLTLLLCGVISLPMFFCDGEPEPGVGESAVGTIVVTSKPPATCSVSIDAKPKGLLDPGATRSFSRVPAGAHAVQLVCGGFKPYSTSIEVHPAKVTFVEAPLTKE
jgi:hypothetical protein